MSWMGKRNAAKREAQRVQDTADIVAEGWAPPVDAHDALMATGEDVCNSPDHDHSRELTDAEVGAALYARHTRLDAETVAEADSQAAESDAERLSRRFLASLRELVGAPSGLQTAQLKTLRSVAEHGYVVECCCPSCS